MVAAVAKANADGLLSKTEEAEFLAYWSEPRASGKPRMTAQDGWDTRLRLQTWRRREDQRERALSSRTFASPRLTASQQQDQVEVDAEKREAELARRRKEAFDE